MTRPTHARRREPRHPRPALTAAYLTVLLTMIAALAWAIASGGPS